MAINPKQMENLFGRLRFLGNALNPAGMSLHVEDASPSTAKSLSNAIRTVSRDLGNSGLPIDTPLPESIGMNAKQFMATAPFFTDILDANVKNAGEAGLSRFMKNNAGRVAKLALLSDTLGTPKLDPDNIFDFVATGADFDDVPTESILGHTFPTAELAPSAEGWVPHKNTALGRWYAKNKR